MIERGDARRRAALLFLAVGALAYGSAPILVRVCRYPSAAVASLRLLLAGLLLAPAAAGPLARFLRRRGWRPFLLLGVPGLLLGLHFQLWVVGIRATSVATGTFLVSINPVFFALAEPLLYRRRIPPRTGLALALVLAGAYWIFRLEGGTLGRVGDLYCLASMLLFVGYLVASRAVSRDVPHLLFIHVIYFWGGVLTLPFLLLPGGAGAVRLEDTASLLALLGLALLPTLVGHTSSNYGVRHFPPLVVSFFTLLEPLFATAAAALLFGEAPRAAVVPAYLLFIAATVLALAPYRRGGEGEAGG
jgi:drug/metabolite transporter (DMT)-like permease